jgi:ABC-type transport system involved in multi-copper enzyme maturation permease subunit
MNLVPLPPPLLGALFDAVPWVGNWLTGVWLVSVGATIGLLVVFLLAALAVPLRNVPILGRLAETKLTLQEGPLFPIFVVTAIAATFGIVGTQLARRPAELLEALARMPQLGDHTYPTFAIDVPPADGKPQEQAIDVSFRRSELRSLTFKASEPLLVSAYAQDDSGLAVRFTLEADQEITWKRGQGSNPFPQEMVDQLFVINQGVGPATLDISTTTALAFPEVATAGYSAAAVIFIFLLYACQRAFLPRISAVALATYKSEVAQPMFLILVLVGVVALVIFEFIPYNTFGEDIKMLKTSGLILIKFLGIIQAVWAASTSISDEVEGRTALTVLSKPLSRREFIIGKYLGILWTVAVMFIILSMVFLPVIAYKPIYDARETSKAEPEADPTGELQQWWQECHSEMVSVVPGMVLVFMEIMVLAALSVAVSTRLPMLANFVISFTVFVLGHITPLLAQAPPEQFEPVRFFGRLVSRIFPVLEYYDIEAAIASGSAVPLEYLGLMLIYTMLYAGIAMFLALILFEDRDLA